MNVRRLNGAGIEKFRELLDLCRSGQRVDVPFDWLTQDSLTEEIGGQLSVPSARYSSRHELASAVIQSLGEENVDALMNDTGLWAWISAVLFDTVCPENSSGFRSPGSDYRHIPSSSYTQYYRHLVRGPVRILRLHPSTEGTAEVVLSQAPDKPGDLVEQLTSRIEIVTNPAVLATANDLYFDSQLNRVKTGTSSKSKPGRPRRLIDFLGQLELTYDLYSITKDELHSLLPQEFGNWMAT